LSALAPSPLVFAPGARVDVQLEGITLTCRLQGVDGPMVRLTAPSGTLPQRKREQPAHLTLYARSGCLEAQTQVAEWVWGRPPMIVAGPVSGWRELCRRETQRMHCSLQARVPYGRGELVGQTQDISPEGISLHLCGSHRVAEGDIVSVHLLLGDGWTPEVRFRVARSRRWLGLGEPVVEIGAEIYEPTPDQGRIWQACLGAQGLKG
jgi:hypothetical protein